MDRGRGKDKGLWDEFVIWLRRKHPGAVVHTREFFMRYLARLFGIVPLSASLSARVFRVDGSVEDMGIISTHVVTDTFVAYLVDSLQGVEADWANFKYHDSGTGTNVEAAGNTALQTPCGEARDVGTQIEGATANIYKSVATNTYAGSFAITEHMLFNVAAAGIGMDRSVFTEINVISGDKVEWTYQLSVTSGG